MKQLLLKRLYIDVKPGSIEFEPHDNFWKEYSELKNSLSISLKRTGKRKVFDVFRIMDTLLKSWLKSNKIACCEGCSYCCLQMVCCTTIEAELIVDWISSQKKKVRSRLKKEARTYALKFYQTNRSIINGSKQWEDIGNALRQKTIGSPCIFLRKGKCSIYPVRPLDCRSCRSTTSCGFNAKPKGVKFYLDQLAADIIMEEEENTYGSFVMYPLASWPISKNLGKHFK